MVIAASYRTRWPPQGRAGVLPSGRLAEAGKELGRLGGLARLSRCPDCGAGEVVWGEASGWKSGRMWQ